MSVGFTSLIVDPSCEFLGAAGGIKKEHRSVETDEEGLTAARRKRISTCRLVHLREDYILRLRRNVNETRELRVKEKAASTGRGESCLLDRKDLVLIYMTSDLVIGYLSTI